MIRNIQIYPVGDADWTMQVSIATGEMLIIESMTTNHSKLIADLLRVIGSLKSPKEQALEKALGVVAESASIEQLADIKDVFPEWQPYMTITKNQIINYEGKLYRAIKDHASEHLPEEATSLWSQINLDEASGVDIIDWYEPDANRNYTLGQLIRYIDGKVYESLLANNVWSPEAFAKGWKLREDLNNAKCK